jgi:hypothetical protein
MTFFSLADDMPGATSDQDRKITQAKDVLDEIGMPWGQRNTRTALSAFYNKQFQRLSSILFIVIVACIGTFLLVGAHAATPYVSLNADNGTLTSGVTIQSDSSASDGKKVVFGSSGYTDAASVDTSRMPPSPQSSTVINLTSPITINSSVTDVTYNVTSSMANSSAITLTSTGSLERVIVETNGLAMNGVAGPGTVKDVAVYDAAYAGFASIKNFEGCDLGQHNYVDFYLSGTGVTEAADAMIKSVDTQGTGFITVYLSSSIFSGAIVSLNGGLSTRNRSATGLETYAHSSSTLFNIVISNMMAGYGLAIYSSATGITINEFYGNDTGNWDSDPGISIGGGAHDNTIHKATIIGYADGLVLGEDVDPSPYGNKIETADIENVPYVGINMNRGAYNNIVGAVGGVICNNCGSVDPLNISKASVSIANRSGETNTPPHGNQVLGLKQYGTTWIPQYALYLGAGTTSNNVSGSASSWSISKLYDGGSRNIVAIPRRARAGGRAFVKVAVW